MSGWCFRGWWTKMGVLPTTLKQIIVAFRCPPPWDGDCWPRAACGAFGCWRSLALLICLCGRTQIIWCACWVHPWSVHNALSGQKCWRSSLMRILGVPRRAGLCKKPWANRAELAVQFGFHQVMVRFVFKVIKSHIFGSDVFFYSVIELTELISFFTSQDVYMGFLSS